jgi:hypothetical protein
MSQLPASAVRTLRPQIAKSPAQRAAAALGPIPVPSPAPAPPPAPARTHDLDVIGPRKLIRPTLPANLPRDRRFQRRQEPVLTLRAAATTPAAFESSHAESFYFQKQMQTQTPLVFVLEDGEKIEGWIEWYDRNAIKVRCLAGSSVQSTGFRPESGVRVLIYKSGIKYLYKSAESTSL